MLGDIEVMDGIRRRGEKRPIRLGGGFVELLYQKGPVRSSEGIKWCPNIAMQG
jgi:hypothetical protein